MFEATPYQRRVIPAMCQGNIMLVWEPGVGKTYPALAASQFLDGPTLCIVPAHLRRQWASAAAEFIPWAPVQILDKTKVKAVIDTRPGALTICSYEYVQTLPRWKELRGIKWAAMAIDEAHYLMNLDANRTRAILGRKPLTEKHGLVNAANCIWALTGTPFQFPHQVYPLLAALFPNSLQRPSSNGPGLMSSREWETEFCHFAPDPSGFGEKVVGAKNIPELRARIAPFLDKVKLKDAVKDLPALITDTIPVKETLTNLTRDLPQDVIDAYERLSEILSDNSVPDEEKLAELEAGGLVMAQLRHYIAVTKINATVEIVKNELASGRKKVLIVGWHREPLKVLQAKLGAALILGGFTKSRVEANKDAFLNDPSVQVLIGQIGAVGTGIDGLQHVCNRLIFHEASWAYRDNKQTIHRLYRTGQTLPVHASFVTLLGSVDEYVASVLKRNAEIVSKVLD